MNITECKSAIAKVDKMLAEAVEHNDWDAQFRFSVVLFFLLRDLTVKQDALLNNREAV